MADREWHPMRYLVECEVSCVVVRKRNFASMETEYHVAVAYKTVQGHWVLETGGQVVWDYAEFYVLPPDPPFVRDREGRR